MEDGLISPSEEGVPQGDPLSPILSNVYLDKPDKELEARGLLFVRYADDCNIFVKSEQAANSRLGLYQQCGMNVFNYALNPKILGQKTKD